MITISIVFLVMVVITLGILWMLERPRARLQEDDSGGSEAPDDMDSLDMDIVSAYYARWLLARGHTPPFKFQTVEELARRYGIHQEEVKRRQNMLQEKIPWMLDKDVI
jgi:hypothetical protein